MFKIIHESIKLNNRPYHVILKDDKLIARNTNNQMEHVELVSSHIDLPTALLALFEGIDKMN